MIKKAVSCTLLVCLTIICLMMQPFLVFADNEPISGFDYTNYYELEYIESNGNQYIDSGITYTNGVRYEFKAIMTSLDSSTQAVFGNTSSGGRQYVGFRTNTYYLGVGANNRTGSISLGSGANVFSGSFKQGSISFYLNNTSLYSSTDSPAYLNHSLIIFGTYNSNNSTISNKSKTKLYYLKWWSNSDNLIAYFVPAERKSDGVYGLYNTVNSSFYVNSGSGTFSAGSRISYTTQYTISTDVSPSGSGSVSGGGTYYSGSSVVLTATPGSGYSFSQWSDGNTSNPRTVTVNGNATYTAVFLPVYTISTSVSPTGSGSVSGYGNYVSGSSVTLTATANSGYVFDHWQDNNTSNPRTVSVSSNATYTAYFVEQTTPVQSFTISTAVSPTGGGSVSGGGTYDEGTSVVLTATASTGYSFLKWSDDITTNPRTITISSNLSITAIFEQDEVEPDPSPSGWSDWTDTDDSTYYEEVTSSINLSKLKWTIYKNRVIDYVVLFGDQYQINSGINGSNLNHISFTGSYYDNSIVGLTGCNSTSYNYSTSSSNQVDVLTIEPAIYGSFDSPVVGEDGTVFNFGIAINGGASSNVTTSTNGFSNTTEACRLIGMNNGDGSVDGTTLLSLGYVKKTITYNDGSTNGHTATVYVPGDENFEFAADLSFLDDLFEQLYVNVVSNLHVWGHDEYTIQMQPQVGYYVPDTGYLWSKAFIGSLLEKVQFTTTSPIQNTNKTFYIVPQENTSASINYHGKFDYSIDNNEYYINRTYLYWKGTTKPKWVFRTDTVDMYSYQDTWGNNMYLWDTYGRSMTYTSSHTVTSADVTHDSNLTLGALMYTGIENIHFYELKNNSILNRFNQLGSFLYEQLNRIYQAIGNITGGNESNEIINNVITEYDIDVETNFNGLLTNVENYKDDIDLTLPEFVIPSSDVDGIESLAGAFKQMYEDVYVDNGLGILIYVPLILLALRLIL